jgi:hypothetical protein
MTGDIKTEYDFRHRKNFGENSQFIKEKLKRRLRKKAYGDATKAIRVNKG